jgi:hypothetical protein
MLSYQIIDANPEWQDRPLTASPRFDAGPEHFRAAHSHAHCAGTWAYRFDDPPTVKPMKMFAADWARQPRQMGLVYWAHHAQHVHRVHGS